MLKINYIITYLVDVVEHHVIGTLINVFIVLYNTDTNLSLFCQKNDVKIKLCKISKRQVKRMMLPFCNISLAYTGTSVSSLHFIFSAIIVGRPASL